MFSRANWDQLKTDIKDISAEIVRLYRCGSSVQHLWDTLTTKDLMTAINANIPSKLKTSKHSVPCINREVKRTLKRNARLFKNEKKTSKWSAYMKCQKECKQKLRKAEWNDINEIISDCLQNNNTKPSWNYAKSKREDNI